MDLHIKSSAGESVSSGQPSQSISLTHLCFEEHLLPEAMTLEPSPGLVLIRVNGAPIRIVCNDRSTTLCEGSCFVAHGTDVSLIAPADSEEDEWQQSTVQRLEVNATVNRSIFLRDCIPSPVIWGFENTTRLEQICGLLDSDGMNPTGVPVCEIPRSLCGSLIVMLLLSSREDENKNTDVDARLDAFRLYCRENLKHKLTLDNMAEALAMSTPSFCRWIRPLLGMPPARYLRNLRLERSQELLRGSSLSLETIAQDCGFANRYHLSREFKKSFGISPIRYRKSRTQNTTESLLEKVGSLMNAYAYADAIDILNQILRSHHGREEESRALFLKAQCLYETKDPRAAVNIWQTLKSGSHGADATLRITGVLLSEGNLERAFAEFTDAYNTGDLALRSRLIDLWIESTSQLLQDRRPEPVRACLDLRRKLFVKDALSAPLTCRALSALCQPLQILEDCKVEAAEKITALRRAGMFDEVLDSMSMQITPSHQAFIRLQAGRYQEILDLHPGARQACAYALVALGRAEEALDRYPQCGNIPLFAMGRYEEILDRYPQDPINWLDALNALGRLEEAVDELVPGSDLWSQVQLRLHPEVLLTDPGNRVCCSAARFLQAIEALADKDDAQAGKALHAIPPVDPASFWHHDYASPVLLLAPLLREWLGEAGAIQSQFDYLYTHYRYAGQQKLWHDIGYLTGKLDDEGFLTQPAQPHMESRLCFVRALRADLDNQHAVATEQYHAYLDALPPLLDFTCLNKAFATWRVEKLSKN